MITLPCTLKMRFFSFLGHKIEIRDSLGNLVAFAHQKVFKLREDIRLYSDESMSRELINIKARNVIDFSASYDVFESTENRLLGSYKRKGLSSILRDRWKIFDAQGLEIGEIVEDSSFMAILRRFLSNLIPQHYNFIINGNETASLKSKFNFFIHRADLLPSDLQITNIDQSFLLAGAILIFCIEGRQRQG